MVQAVERAKQVTMAELNAIIGVCGLSILALIVFFFKLVLFLFSKGCFFVVKFSSLSESKSYWTLMDKVV